MLLMLVEYIDKTKWFSVEEKKEVMKDVGGILYCSVDDNFTFHLPWYWSHDRWFCNVHNITQSFRCLYWMHFNTILHKKTCASCVIFVQSCAFCQMPLTAHQCSSWTSSAAAVLLSLLCDCFIDVLSCFKTHTDLCAHMEKLSNS